MEDNLEPVRLLLKSICGGIMISLGGMAYLSVENKVVGAFLFSIGLFCILNFQYALFTGKAYTVYNTKKFWELPIVYIGNFLGTYWMGILLPYLNTTAQERVVEITANKLQIDIGSAIALGVLCNFMIAIAVKCFNSNDGIVRYIGTFLAVPIFILCGFEHSIADTFYFSCIGMPHNSIRFVLFVSLGNLIGGFFFWAYDAMCVKKFE